MLMFSQSLETLFDGRDERRVGVVERIEEEGIHHLYDVTVEGSHTYVVNGVITHNTTLGANIAYNNAKKLNYNLCYISLEVSKDDMMFNFLSRHSFDTKFPDYPFIPHKKIRECTLDESEEQFLMGTVLEDFFSQGGRIKILDESDFRTFSFSEIRSRLEKVDDEFMAQTGYGLDGVIWDHANLFKFNQSGSRKNDGNAEINEYISFIRKMGIAFRKDPQTGKMRKLSNIILMQVNRTGWKKAVKNSGKYSLDALAEANEAERSSQMVMTVFTDENMKMSKEAVVSLLKNRNGPTFEDTISIFVDPEAYVAGEEMEGFSDMMSMGDLEDVFGAGGSIDDLFNGGM